MNKKEKIVYSNSMAKVNKEVERITSKEFRKKCVIVTSAQKYYIYQEDKRYNSEAEVIKKLKEQGIKSNQIKYIEHTSSYYENNIVSIIKGENNNWFDLIFFRLITSIGENNLFELRGYGVNVIRIYKDGKFKVYRKNGEEWIHYNVGTRTALNNDLSFGLEKPKEIKRYLSYQANDIRNKIIPTIESWADYRRKINIDSLKIISEVFGKDVSAKVDNYSSLKDFLRAPTANPNAQKAKETREELINSEFIPILQKIQRPKQKFDEKEIKKLEKRGYVDKYNEFDRRSKCFHRINDWIIYTNTKEERVFYNAETKKKYMVYYRPNSLWYKDCSIGVFRIEDLIYSLNPYETWGYDRNHVTMYKAENGRIPNYNDYVTLHPLEEEYEYAPECFDENNNKISPYKCFEGTEVVDFLNTNLDLEYKVPRLEHENNHKITSICSVKELIDKNRCIGLAFLLLCIKKDLKQIAEQMYKTKLNGFLFKMITDPQSFVKSSDSMNEYSAFIKYNEDGTNLKKSFSLPMDKIKICDEIIMKNIEEKCSSKRTPFKLKDIQNAFGDKIKTMDNNTFKGYLEYASTSIGGSLDYLGRVVEQFPEKTPKDILNLIKKVGSLYTYSDYLIIRKSYISMFEGEEAETIKKIYKKIPEKAKRFKYLRPERSRYYGNIMSPEEQLEEIRRRYNDVTGVEDENRNVVGVVLDMSPTENVQFLHDELSKFITQHREEINAKGFKEAATRLLKYEYTGKELSIVAPRESKELAIEGGTLNHCVAGFIEPVINDTENVLFIRRNDMLTDPYYTIALDKQGNIEQIHCFGNGDLSESEQRNAFNNSGLAVYNKQFDLIKFLKEWAKEKQGLINEKTIKLSYGRLCANR